MKKVMLILIGIFLVSIVSATGMLDPYGDYDGDGVLNKDDNCYYVYNPFQIDSDKDNYGDVCDPSPFGYCGDGLCIGDENYLNCLEDCEAPFIPDFCGNSVIEGDEQCDDGDDNGIACDNSTSSCTYCSSECELITLPYSSDYQQTKSSHQNHFVQFCDVDWKCSGWSECVNRIKTRKCYDKNYCDYSYNKPIEKTGCDMLSKVLVGEDEFNPVFILLGAITSLILIAVLVVFLGRR